MQIDDGCEYLLSNKQTNLFPRVPLTKNTMAKKQEEEDSTRKTLVYQNQ